CFLKDPEDRPSDMGEVAAGVREVYQEVTGRSYPRKAPGSAEALAGSLNNRAVSLLNLNKRAEAEQLWQEALAAGPVHPEPTSNLGLTRWGAGRATPTDLVQKLLEVCASHPNEWLPSYLLAQVHLENADWPAAIETLDQLGRPGAVPDEVRAALELARERSAVKYPGKTLGNHDDWVSSVAMSGDGRLALSGSADRTLRLWETATGKCLRSLAGHTEWVTAVCLSGDALVAVSGSADKSLKVWDLATGKCRYTLLEHAR